MIAEVVRRPERQAVDIYLLDPMRSGCYQIAPSGVIEWQEVAQGAEMIPFLRLPIEAFAQIMAAGADILPPSAATVEALRDTREVRDRLLTMVERAARK